MLDNYDSFTYILVQYFAELGADVTVRRNDEVSLSDIEDMNLKGIIISPGPCTPREAGISNDVLRHFAGKIPLFGVCLGMQCMAEVFGGEVIKATTVMHGKTSLIEHTNKGVFHGLPSPLRVTRYHSLVANPTKLPEDFEVTAWANDNNHREIMGIKHKTLAIEGVQFHPESFLSEKGHELLKHFLLTCQTPEHNHARL